MAERPKTVGLMQDVFAADGDMATVTWSNLGKT